MAGGGRLSRFYRDYFIFLEKRVRDNFSSVRSLLCKGVVFGMYQVSRAVNGFVGRLWAGAGGGG